MLIRQMVDDLDVGVKIVGCPRSGSPTVWRCRRVTATSIPRSVSRQLRCRQHCWPECTPPEATPPCWMPPERFSTRFPQYAQTIWNSAGRRWNRRPMPGRLDCSWPLGSGGTRLLDNIGIELPGRGVESALPVSSIKKSVGGTDVSDHAQVQDPPGHGDHADLHTWDR